MNLITTSEPVNAVQKEIGATGLLPCPFCGAQPTTDVFEDEEDHFHLVQCANDDCPVEPIATGATAADADDK